MEDNCQIIDYFGYRKTMQLKIVNTRVSPVSNGGFDVFSKGGVNVCVFGVNDKVW